MKQFLGGIFTAALTFHLGLAAVFVQPLPVGPAIGSDRDAPVAISLSQLAGNSERFDWKNVRVSGYVSMHGRDFGTLEDDGPGNGWVRIRCETNPGVCERINESLSGPAGLGATVYTFTGRFFTRHSEHVPGGHDAQVPTIDVDRIEDIKLDYEAIEGHRLHALTNGRVAEDCQPR